MKRHTTTSSLDELLSLHCEEEIEFKLHSDSSLATFSLNDGEINPKSHHRHYKSKFEHRHRNRYKPKSKTESVGANITQEIHVERQEFGCIINLNTTVCGHRQQVGESPKTEESKLLERPVPHCMRKGCHKPRHYKTRCPRRSREQCKKNLHERSSGLNKTHRCVKQSEQDKQDTQKKSRHTKKHSKETVGQKYYHSRRVTPALEAQYDDISNRSLDIYPALEAQYDDISNKSLDIYLEIPTSYKNVIKTSKDEYQPSKLDTLIKRAKERERKLVLQSRNDLTHTSTYMEASTEEFMSCSELEASLHSRSTLVLDHWEYEDSQLKTKNLQQTDKEAIDAYPYKIKAERQERKQSLEMTHDSQLKIENLQQTDKEAIDAYPFKTKAERQERKQSSEMIHIGYSPSIGICTNKCRRYSPSSIPHELWKPPDNVLNIKEELAMDIDAYSPTQSPDLRTLFEDDKCGKIQIKNETYN